MDLDLDEDYEIEQDKCTNDNDSEKSKSNEKVNYTKKAKPISPKCKLIEGLKSICESNSIVWNDRLENDLPKKWKIFSDLAVLPQNCFKNDEWNKIDENIIWKCVADALKVRRLAQENRIKSDDYRTPNVKLLVGNDPWVLTVNNGIKYTYDICRCMFSAGNITEKMRVSSFNCNNEIVIDLFAGIGYFTLPYILHTNAKKVIACEWNPAAIESLRRNLELNNCVDRCELLEGDNRTTCPVNCADRVNLGLIPTSEMTWPTACKALRTQTGGYLHIHGNVDIKLNNEKKDEWNNWAVMVQSKIKSLLEELNTNDTVKTWNVSIEHIEFVKSYGPRVDHLVLDLNCRPQVLVK